MKITVNQIELFYQKSGNAPQSVLLLHGNGEDHHIFDPLSEKLAADFTVYALDSRGHGASERTSDFSYEAMAQDISQFIAKLGLAPCSLIGFSDGGITALLLAARHPELVTKIAVLGANLSPADFKKKELEQLKEDYQKTHDPLIHLMLTEPNLKKTDLQQIKAEALILAGEKDVFYRKTFYTIAKTIKQSKLHILAGHNHDSYIVQNAMLYPELKAFFREKKDKGKLSSALLCLFQEFVGKYLSPRITARTRGFGK
ncbi:hypothetical protein MFLO_12796 [Listeria floridensis FSL S10-1187]|uniref:AB hydrolase-1 domain-containing protein n=1 Tax=Listeria floridensis FSL S10-1187 TaxID=1265817 RepID=A0ABN0RD03_9LIST|nr:alpha/beta hydrolase [Listeria floridensis]EUJ28040.1 hypothetical protein MFLO_12796 [Listeria floridensis FSL S10-1187]